MTNETTTEAAEWLATVQTEAEQTITAAEPVVISEPLTDDQVWGEPGPHADDPDEEDE